MTTKLDPFDGTIEVRVVLYVKVDPRAWAENMMGEHPDEVHHRDVRADVKSFVAATVGALQTYRSDKSEMDNIPISSVVLESPHPRRS